MLDKVVETPAKALADIRDGCTVMVGGFGGAGAPIELIHALIDQGARNLVVISNNAGSGNVGLGALIAAGRVSKVICSYPRSLDSSAFDTLYRAGKIELELVPQGTLAERIRAAGAGIPAFYTPTAVGTMLAAGKEHREFEGRVCIQERALGADLSLIKCAIADRIGNLTYNKTARNFAPLMATAAKLTVVQCARLVAPGVLDPEVVVTPGIFVDRIVPVCDPAHEEALVAQGARYP